MPTVSALDEVVKLFLYREKKSLMHEFEQEDEGGVDSERKSRKNNNTEEADSTTTSSATSTLPQRPKPPPSLLGDNEEVSETIEEAGLKWRLIGGNKHGGTNRTGASLTGGTSRSSSE